MVLVAYAAYLPLAKLVNIMQEKGFLKKEDRPSTLRVLRVYVARPARALRNDLASKSWEEVWKTWVAGEYVVPYEATQHCIS
jgi:hypothetical protein